jgi:hypothetical protein
VRWIRVPLGTESLSEYPYRAGALDIIIEAKREDGEALYVKVLSDKRRKGGTQYEWFASRFEKTG